MKTSVSAIHPPEFDDTPEVISFIHPAYTDFPIDAINTALYRAESVLSALSTNGQGQGEFSLNRKEVLGCLSVVSGQLTQIRQLVDFAYKRDRKSISQSIGGEALSV